MSSRSWSASGRTRPAAAERPRGKRPPGSFAVSIARAVAVWDDLTGGPTVDLGPDTSHVPSGQVVPADDLPKRYGYTDTAAAAIVGLAVALWADTAADMPDGEG